MTATEIVRCRSCLWRSLETVIDLGEQRLADFRDTPELSDAYPLELVYCSGCHLVQLRHSVPPAEMYHDRYGFKSGVNGTIRADLASIVVDGKRWNPGVRRWLDIASNDGTLLGYVNPDIVDQSHHESRIFTVGIDPVSPLCRQAADHADVIVNDYFAAELVAEHGPFDVVTSISMFYDLDDPHAFIEGVDAVLSAGGVWIVQQNYVGAMLAWSAVDNICHEHRKYYSLISLEALLAQHGFEVFDVYTSSVNGGSFRTAIARRGERAEHDSVDDLRRVERSHHLDSPEPYLRFARDVRLGLDELRDLVRSINARGERVWIYGASTRGGTLWQSAGLTSEDLPFAVDRNPAKVGKFMSSIGTPIISEEQARAEQPEYMIVSPWFFRDELVEREREYLERGGKLIFPLPSLDIVS